MKKPVALGMLLVLALSLAACNQASAPALEESLQPLGQNSSMNAVVFDLTCERVGTITVATNGQSYGVPFDILGTNDVFILAEFSYVVTDSSGTVVEKATIPTGQGKKRGLQNELITCTTTGTLTRDRGVLTVLSTYQGFISSQGQVKLGEIPVWEARVRSQAYHP